MKTFIIALPRLAKILGSLSLEFTKKGGLEAASKINRGLLGDSLCLDICIPVRLTSAAGF
jgi:hypothetical protein